jgi:hypothetical protein
VTKRADYAVLLDALVAGSDDLGPLERFLAAQSGLPGPRGNLELADAFADVVTRLGVSARLRASLDDWLALDAASAPTNDPREFLPFCALQALGVLYVTAAPSERRSTETTFRHFADDVRWRVREGVAMALQRIAERNFELLHAICDNWLPDATLLGRRAIVAALAHPPVLGESGRAAYCLELAVRIVGDLVALDPAQRKAEAFRVLRQGLEYAVSVFAA